MRIIAATFRVARPDLDPTVVTGLLGRAPTASHRRGERAQTRASVPVFFPEGQWELSSTLEDSDSVEAHIRALVDWLTTVVDGLRTLRSDGCRLDIIVGIQLENGMGGWRLSAETLRRIGELQIDLDVDLYSV